MTTISKTTSIGTWLLALALGLVLAAAPARAGLRSAATFWYSWPVGGALSGAARCSMFS